MRRLVLLALVVVLLGLVAVPATAKANGPENALTALCEAQGGTWDPVRQCLFEQNVPEDDALRPRLSTVQNVCIRAVGGQLELSYAVPELELAAWKCEVP